jgi:hypothetical protein
MKEIILKYLKEAVGVPLGIERSAKNLFDDLIKKFDSGEYTDSYIFKNSGGRYSFLDFDFDNINFNINLVPYNGDKLQFGGFGFGENINVGDSGRIEIKPSDSIYLQATIIVPQNINSLSAEDVADLFKNQRSKIISILSHELKHAYDSFKKPIKTVINSSKYQTYSSLRTGLKPIDELIFDLYYISAIESLVRPSEIYTLMREKKISKKDFLDFLENTETYQNLLSIRNFSYREFREKLKQYKDEIEDIVLGFHDVDELPDDFEETLDIFLGGVYIVIGNKVASEAQSIVMSGLGFLSILTGIPKNKKIVLDKIMKDIRKYEKNPIKYYEFLEKMFRFESMKMIKKLSKLYSLAIDNKVNSSIKDPISREIGVNEVKLGLKSPEKINNKRLFK